MSSTPTALTSCKVTSAVPKPPSEMYSGSASCTNGVPGQAIRYSPTRGTPAKPAVLTVDFESFLFSLMTVTLPCGSSSSESASPSFATSRYLSCFANVSMSGSDPAGNEWR